MAGWYGDGMDRWYRVLAPLTLVLACSDAPSWHGRVQVAEGVEVVSNPEEPLLGDVSAAWTELWDLREADWLDPSRVHVGSALVTLVDRRANRVHLVSLSGEVRGSLGGAGGGPGEFLGLVDAFPEGGGLVALDGGKGSVEYLDLDGNHLSSLYVEGQAWGGFPLGNGTLLLQGEFLADPLKESAGDWVSVREGRAPRAFDIPVLEPLPVEEGVQCSSLTAWGEGAARLRQTTPWIQRFDASGALLGESRIALPVEVVSREEREEALSAMRRAHAARGMPPEFTEQSVAVMGERWRVKCRFGPLRFDRSGRLAAILEQNPDDFGSGNATLHLLTQDGVYLARAHFSNRWRDFALENGVVYALTLDPLTDLVTLRAYRIGIEEAAFRQAERALAEARGG